MLTRSRPALVAFAVLLLAVGAFLTWSGRDGGTDRSGGSDQGVAQASPSGSVDPESGLPWVPESDLPPQARETLRLVDAGGPFPYPGKDGSRFGNFEGLLPAHERGYYAEYTVPTPGSTDRGARRIIAGEGGERYWTQDHYASFARIWREAP